MYAAIREHTYSESVLRLGPQVSVGVLRGLEVFDPDRLCVLDISNKQECSGLLISPM